MFYKKKVKDTKPKGTPKTLLLLKGQQKPWGGVKPACKLKRVEAIHLQGWMAKPIDTNWEEK
jgi:hypothetical protein